MTVSYTHLDVYKRQVLVAAIGAAVVGCIIFLPKIVGIIQAEFR